MIYLDEAIGERHSVRAFQNKKVSGGMLRKILEAGRLAPSAKNRQPWRFALADERQQQKIASLLSVWAKEHNEPGSTVAASAKIVADAPALIAVFLKKSPASAVSDYISVGACLENMSLKAVDLGLGSLIVCDGQCVGAEISALFGREEELAALFITGYGRGEAGKPYKRPLSELATGFEEEDDETIVDDLPQAFIGEEPFLFVSYSHRDANTVISDIVELKRHGVRLWYDRSIACGEAWDARALGVMGQENCAGVLVYVSEHSASSPSVKEELEFADRRFGKEGARIIGVHVGDKPLSAYLGASEECDAAFRKVFTEKNKYIPRSKLVGAKDAVVDIVAEAARLGAVSECGVYDEFRYVLQADGVKITQYSGSSVTVEFPASIAGKPVTAIGKNAMRGNDLVKKIVLPQTVVCIEEGAFFEMQNLTDVNLPQGLQYLGVAAFRGCVSLERVRLPHGLKKLEEALFRDCTALAEMDVPAGVEEFGEAVFRGCGALKRVYVPDSVKRMTEGGFFGCTSLADLRLPKDIEGLEEGSFLTCPLVNIDAGGFAFRAGSATRIA